VKVKAVFLVAILSNRSVLVTGLESVVLLLLVILALHGLCRDDFQEDCGPAGKGWRCCTSSCMLTPTNEIDRPLCSKEWERQADTVGSRPVSQIRALPIDGTGDFSTAIELEHKSPLI